MMSVILYRKRKQNSIGEGKVKEAGRERKETHTDEGVLLLKRCGPLVQGGPHTGCLTDIFLKDLICPSEYNDQLVQHPRHSVQHLWERSCVHDRGSV